MAQVQFYVKGHSVSLFLQFPQQSMQWVFLMLRNRSTTLNSRKYTYCACRSWLCLRLIVWIKKSIRSFCSQDRCFFVTQHATSPLECVKWYVAWQNQTTAMKKTSLSGTIRVTFPREPGRDISLVSWLLIWLSSPFHFEQRNQGW